MSEASINLAVVEAAAFAALTEVAEAIAVQARDGYQMHELKTDDPDDGVIVEVTPEGPDVVTYNSVAHLDEWGGTNVHSTPSGAMRSAAAAHGVFFPAGKP